MDKYLRNDDKNDDLEVYKGETYEGMSIIKPQGAIKQNLRVFGHTEEENELLERVEKKKSLLSPRQLKLLNLVVNEGCSIRHAAKRMKITQQAASGYWKIIKEKMK